MASLATTMIVAGCGSRSAVVSSTSISGPTATTNTTSVKDIGAGWQLIQSNSKQWNIVVSVSDDGMVCAGVADEDIDEVRPPTTHHIEQKDKTGKNDVATSESVPCSRRNSSINSPFPFDNLVYRSAGGRYLVLGTVPEGTTEVAVAPNNLLSTVTMYRQALLIFEGTKADATGASGVDRLFVATDSNGSRVECDIGRDVDITCHLANAVSR